MIRPANFIFRKFSKLQSLIKKKLSNSLEAIRFAYTLREITKTNFREVMLLLGTPLHGNIGDHAITKAELQFCKDHFPHLQIVEIPFQLAIQHLDELKRRITEHVILINGGGFLGTLWSGNEKKFRMIIEHFPDNSILLFPQTIYYENSEKAKQDFDISKEIYGKHSRLTLFAREEKSYQLMKNAYMHNQVYLAPDMVLYLDESHAPCPRDGILVCIRNDKESILQKKRTAFNQIIAEHLDEKINFTDTYIENKYISPNDREKFIQHKLREFKTSKLVITDRLHGMIFAVITGTPCIALNNLSGKVNGVYQWLRDVPSLKFAESIDEIPLYAAQLLNLTHETYDRSAMRGHFGSLQEAIEKLAQ